MKKILGLGLGICIVGSSMVAFANDEISSIVRGGLLYDKWYKVINAEKPTDTHPAWPVSNTKKKGDATQRCKACHGWDMMGKDGAYASGSYKTGIKGLRQMEGVAPQEIAAIIKDQTHAYEGKMSEQDILDLALFVSKGQVDMDMLIERSTKKAKGDAAQGSTYYNTMCVNCHGKDGSQPKEMPLLGMLANDNPWEILHKILNGQPAERMPALRALDHQVSADVLSYLQTLPVK
ncbi:hypothetical protein GCM10011332_27640 [Terasakiella brassicae]|uniref:Cytochrome c domain-containing protein n=1 Tax=Terasakiella brassicae TaxID=1634917 RepID=A0A917C5R1_9PROT|nr:c-type cytochrome [Terasakiella brassicae]GGF72133.1 hypothetical protein GCM10011332_27640 [Terasakiella brassicae]